MRSWIVFWFDVLDVGVVALDECGDLSDVQGAACVLHDGGLLSIHIDLLYREVYFDRVH